MRLTLRTVLAYLDDTLQPSQAREIGEKIADSKEATALVSRIREVIRRRRIGAPELAGAGSGPDPNLVADYLENSLPPNQVVEIEKLCQNSDIHLAEVAACHKILTMVVGHPVDVADEIRERIYLLGASTAETATAQADPLAPPMPEGMSDTGAHSRLAPLPEYLTRDSGSGRWAVAGGLLLLAAGWLALVLTDPALWTALPIAGLTQPIHDPLPPVGEPQPPVEMDVAADPGPLLPVLPAPPGPALPLAAVVLSQEIPPQIPISPVGDPTPVVPIPPAPPSGPPASPAAEVLVELELLSRQGDGIVITRLPVEGEWKMLDLANSVRLSQDIAVPDPFRQEFSLGSDVTLTLEPGARIQRVARTAGALAALELNRGRIILSRSAASSEPFILQLEIHRLRWFVSLDQPGTRVAVEFVPPSVVDFTQPLVPPASLGGCAVAAGAAKIWLDGSEPVSLTLAAGFVPFAPDLKSLNMPAAAALPPWSTPEGVSPTQAARSLAKLFEKEFLRDRTVAQSISPVVKDRRAGVAELAVKTVALTDRYQDLIPGLSAENQEPRVAAIAALRVWAALDSQNSVLLRQELANNFRPDQLDIIDRLLLGITLADARDAQLSQALVSFLAHDDIAIRELAIVNLQRITGKTHDYLAMARTLERRAAINRWEDVLRSNGGTLLPLVTPPATTP